MAWSTSLIVLSLVQHSVGGQREYCGVVCEVCTSNNRPAEVTGPESHAILELLCLWVCRNASNCGLT